MLTLVADGRIEIDLSSRLTRSLVKLVPADSSSTQPQLSRRNTVHRLWTIRLNVVIQVVGSRGDVQPFIALGLELKRYGHRVRLATHDCFENFVLESGLEFYPIGGDPKDLMAYMVKNPGLIPSMKSIREGDIQRKRDMMGKMLNGCWKSCIEPDQVSQQPFVADAIIANPPSFAHIHCAQALGIPLHMMFTMPWSSTRHFPHPLANFKGSEMKNPALLNYSSYGIVEFLTWQGLGDVINKFRATLDLQPVPASVGPVLAEALEIPFTYCWSPALVSKPPDWPSHIDVCGFFFRDAPNYTPPPELQQFLEAGSPPVYIGFGSIVLEDPARFTSIIFEVVRQLGIRAIVSRGWSNLGEGLPSQSKDVLFIGDCPHEWLFQHVSAVVHHGGAGTTACGLQNACPTAVVPFFGDQPFWGNMIAAAGAGPSPIPQKQLTLENLADAVRLCLKPVVKEAAQNIAERMASERGVEAAVQSFHANLPLETMQCPLMPTSVASWLYKKNNMKLSKLAAQLLIENGSILQSDLTSHQTQTITIINNRWDPITSTGSAGFGIVGDMTESATGLVRAPIQEYKKADKQTEKAMPVVTAGKMLGSTLREFGKFNVVLLKGAVVDLPLATTEGFRNVPKLYGEQPKDHGEVSDIVSGFQVGAKTFAHGMVDGFSDPFRQTYEHGKKEGALGAAKGFGKGMAGFISKTSMAMVGIVAYPGDGVAKSIRYLAKSATRKQIVASKLVEGQALAARHEVNVDVTGLIQAFDKLTRETQKA